MALIGFVGLGHMGLPMAINLVKAGHQVTGYDLLDSAKKEFLQANGQIATSIRELAQDKEVLITMLQTGKQVLQVCDGKDGLFNYAKKGSLYLDCSTIDVQSSRELHQLAQMHQIDMVDAPVSGGVAGAKAATLTFMVGGEDSVFDKAKNFLAHMGKNIIHAGGAGSGEAAKICNNMILGASMIAISEAFILGKKLGLTPKQLFEVVSNSSGQCWSLSKYVPVAGILENVPANNEYKPGFAANMMLKDLNLSQEAAHSVHANTPLGARATALYQQFIDQGFGELDFSAIIKQLENSLEG